MRDGIRDHPLQRSEFGNAQVFVRRVNRLLHGSCQAMWIISGARHQCHHWLGALLKRKVDHRPRTSLQLELSDIADDADDFTPDRRPLSRHAHTPANGLFARKIAIREALTDDDYGGRLSVIARGDGAPAEQRDLQSAEVI